MSLGRNRRARKSYRVFPPQKTNNTVSLVPPCRSVVKHLIGSSDLPSGKLKVCSILRRRLKPARSSAWLNENPLAQLKMLNSTGGAPVLIFITGEVLRKRFRESEICTDVT